MLESEIEEGMRVEFRKIRENNLLIFGVLIGIIGGLLAGVINDLIRGSALYPWIYLLILITILLILIFVLLAPYFDWKRFEHGLDKRMKEIKNVLGDGIKRVTEAELMSQKKLRGYQNTSVSKVEKED